MTNSLLRSRLIQIFMRRFNLSETQALSATIKSTEGWDSFTHMDLMLELESDFELKQLSGDDFANLVSFEAIFEYLGKVRN